MGDGWRPGVCGLDYGMEIDDGTLARFPMFSPGPVSANRIAVDELTPIATYMASEMNKNAASDKVARMREYNEYSSSECIDQYTQQSIWARLFGLGITPEMCITNEISFHIAALLLWTEQVMQDGPWDHKPIIRRRFHPRVPNGEQVWHLYRGGRHPGGRLYYYDVWSNIHYGYVGVAAGFSDSQLLDGAGLEQIGSTLVRGAWPTRDASVSGLRAWDDPSDREGIQIGIRMYRNQRKTLSASDLVCEIVMNSRITSKPSRP